MMCSNAHNRSCKDNFHASSINKVPRPPPTELMMVLKIQSLKASMKEPVRRQKMAVASRPVRREGVARQHNNILATSSYLQLRKLGDIHYRKLGGVALLVTDPPRVYFTTAKNPPIFVPPLDIAITSEPIITFANHFIFKI